MRSSPRLASTKAFRRVRGGVVGLTLAATIAPAAAHAPAPRRVVLDGLRDTRSCDVLAVHENAGNAVATIYSTLGVGACSPVGWDSLSVAPIRAQLKASSVVKFGPLFATADHVAFDPQGGSVIFGGMTFVPVGRLSVPLATLRPTTIAQPYTEATLQRHVRWTWDAHRPVYELVSSNGRRYAMESYGHGVDTTLSPATLPAIGKRLRLPYRWTYRVVTPASPLVIDSVDGTEHLLQDDLHDVYAREN